MKRNIKSGLLNKVLQVFVLLIIHFPAFAQQKPQFTQYLMNQYILNPAITGIENYTDIKLSYRHQWTGINGSPATYYFSAHTPVKKKDYRLTATSYQIPEANTRYKNNHQFNYAEHPHHGIGFQAYRDAAGPITNTSAYVTYAYHLGITPRLTLAAGFGAGFSSYGLNTSLLDFNNTITDPVTSSGNYVYSNHFDLNSGLYLYSQNFFAGISGHQLVPSELEFGETVVTSEDNLLVPHIFLHTGYRFNLENQINVIPSLLVKYVTPNVYQFDINCKAQYKDLLWIGSGYRIGDGASFMAGMNFLDRFSLSYSYDFTTSGLNIAAIATHEIVVGYIIGNRYKSGCPSLLW